MNGTATELALQLGDTVRLGTQEFSDAVVSKIVPAEDPRFTQYTLFRPYVHTADFSMGAHPKGTKVITYIGHEEFEVFGSSTLTLVRRRAEPLK